MVTLFIPLIVFVQGLKRGLFVLNGQSKGPFSNETERTAGENGVPKQNSNALFVCSHIAMEKRKSFLNDSLMSINEFQLVL